MQFGTRLILVQLFDFQNNVLDQKKKKKEKKTWINIHSFFNL